ncbi:MAG: SET domain-containing protein-lysine N-methyltransferase [Planktomarina sp.]
MSGGNDGFCFSYEVKETVDKGQGVFANEPIKKGSVVWRHVPGQYIVYDEKTFKVLISEMTYDEAVYELTHVFGLLDFPDCVIRVLDAGVLFNHESDCNLITNNQNALEVPPDSTSPNYIQDVTMALLDVRYAMIATRDIEAGEEFTNNYETEVNDPPFFDILYELYEIEDTYLDNGN